MVSTSCATSRGLIIFILRKIVAVSVLRRDDLETLLSIMRVGRVRSVVTIVVE